MPGNQDEQHDHQDSRQSDDRDIEGETFESHPHIVLPARSEISGSSRRVVVATRSHQGPLPPVEYMRAIQEVVPDGAERIFVMAEKHAEHRRWMERTRLEASVAHNKGNLARSNWGLTAGFGIAIAFLGVAADLISKGHEISGTIVGSVDIIGLVSVFVIGRLTPSKPMDEKPGVTDQSSEEPGEDVRKKLD